MATLAEEIAATARGLGIDPIDLATAISYETGGTFDPWQAGPTTKWGQHRGLIQMGEPQRAQYGYEQGAPLGSQMGAVSRYLTDTGVQPGMGLLDIYSAINAGGVGRYDRNDAAAGGAPGTVRDKVEQQMGGHREKAVRLLSGGPQMAAANNSTWQPPAPQNPIEAPREEQRLVAQQPAPQAPMAPPPQQGNPLADMMASMAPSAPRAPGGGQRMGFESSAPMVPFIPTEVNTRVQDPSLTSTSLQPLQGLLAPSLFGPPPEAQMKRPTRTPDTKVVR